MTDQNNRPKKYRVRKDVQPYGGRLLTSVYEEPNMVGGRIRGAIAVRWYERGELERVFE